MWNSLSSKYADGHDGSRNLLLLATACGALSLLLGALTLAGWLLGVPGLVQLRPGWAPMVMATSLCFTASGLGLLVPDGRPWQALRRLIGGLLAVLSIAAIAEIAFGVDLMIDLPLLHSPVQPDNIHPGRMAPNTAIAFLLIGATLALMDRCPGARRAAALQLVIFVIVALGVSGVIGYPLKLEFLYEWAGVTPMAPQTGVGVLLCGFGLGAKRNALVTQNDEPATVTVGSLLTASSVVLLSVVLVSSLVAFSMLQERVQRLATVGLEQRLAERLRLLETVLDDNIRQAGMIGTDGRLAGALRVLQRQPLDAGARQVLLSSAEALLHTGGFSALAYETPLQRQAQAGRFLDAFELSVALTDHPGSELTWQDGYLLRSRLPLLDDQGVAGYVIAEQALPMLDRITLELD